MALTEDENAYIEKRRALRAQELAQKEEEKPSILDDILDFFSDTEENAAIQQQEIYNKTVPLSAADQEYVELRRRKRQEELQEKKDSAPEDISTITDIGRGALSGIIGIGEGLVTLGTSVVDLVADTDSTESAEQVFSDVRDYLGADPQGTAGEVAEVLFQFGIPGLGAAGLVSKASMASRGASSALGLAKVGEATKYGFIEAPKAVQAALRLETVRQAPAIVKHMKQIGAAAAADMAVATDGVTTLGDFFGGPTERDVTIGLQGREEAIRQLGNRLKFGAESATIVGSLPVAGKVISGTVKGATTVAEPVLKPLSEKLLSPGLTKLGSILDNAQFSENGVMQFLNKGFAALRSRGNLPDEIYDASVFARGSADAELAHAKGVVLQMKKLFDKNLSRGMFSLSRSTDDALLRQEMYEVVEKALAREKVLIDGKEVDAFMYMRQLFDEKLDTQMYKGSREWIEPLMNTVRMARNHIDDLSRQFVDLPNLKTGLETTIRENIGSYMTRMYRSFTDKNWYKHVKNSKEGKKLIDAARADIIASSKASGKELTAEQADEIIERILKAKPGSVTGSLDESVLKVLPKGILEQRKDISAPIRALMGEIKDPRSHYVHTIAKQAAYLADRKLYDTVAAKGSSLIDDMTPGKRYVYSNVEDIPEDIADQFVKVQSTKANVDSVAKYGDLAGMYVRQDVLKALERTGRFIDQDQNMFYTMYANTFLPLKGMSQYVKTVLSPITQVRNLLSASMFAMANGNVGFAAGQSRLGTSFRVVKNMVLNQPQGELDDMVKFLRQRGVINTNVQVEEMRRLLSREAHMGDTTMLNTGEIFATIGAKGASFGERVRGLRPLQLAQDMYQGSDDLWKTYSFMFERDKLIGAGIAKEEASEMAAKIVRNTVPNYSAVPTFIKDLRKLPFGNFIAFPAEIMRTSYNILKQSVDEMASSNAKIREIGMRRFFGLSSVVAGSNEVVQVMGEQLSGVSRDEMDLVQQHFVAPWQKNSVLVPTGRKKDGTITFIDFSYMNPYDYLRRPMEAIDNAIHNGNLRGLDVDSIMLDITAEVGKEMFGPFATPSIMAQKLIDWKTGSTPEGRVVWRDQDELGTKIAKGFLHTLEGITPPFMPLDTKGAPETFARGDFAHAGRFSTAAWAAITGSEDNMDYRGRQYELGGELFRLMSGVTEQEVNFSDSLKFKGFEHGSGISDATRSFTSSMTRGGMISDEEAIQALEYANKQRFRSYQDLSLAVQAAEALGAKRSDVMKALKGAKVGNIPEIVNGVFVPYFPTDETIERIQSMPEDLPPSQRNRLPMRELREVFKSFNRASLFEEPPSYLEPRDQVVPNVLPEATAPSRPAPQAQPEPQASAAPAASQGIASMQMSQRPYTPAEMSALGLSPLEQAIKEKQQIGVV